MIRNILLATTGLLVACGGAPAPATAADTPFSVTEVASFDEPWAMTFLPGGETALITEKRGVLKLFRTNSGESIDVSGVPAVDYGGQGGLGDVVLHPDFANNGYVYLSFAEAGDGDTRGAAIARARLTIEDGGASLGDVQIIWRQEPKVTGRGHFGHRIAFGPDGFMYVSSGERQKFDPAQDMTSNMGKIVRLTDGGMVPSDNPYYDQGRVKSQIWTAGHRNPLGIAFDAAGQLWAHEMGPSGGDELNLISRGKNYGYPVVSNGDHYDGRDIPDHVTRPEFEAPKITWTPVISPAGLVIYSGDLFADWKGDALIGGLSGETLVRVEFDGTSAREAARYPMGARIREVEQGPDGAIWLLQDGKSGGKLLKLMPPRQLE